MACQCLCINFGLHAAAAKELTINHRQIGNTSWSDHLNMRRPSNYEEGLDATYDVLNTRIGDQSSGPVSEVEFRDAMCLYVEHERRNEYLKTTSVQIVY